MEKLDEIETVDELAEWIRWSIETEQPYWGVHLETDEQIRNYAESMWNLAIAGAIDEQQISD